MFKLGDSVRARSIREINKKVSYIMWEIHNIKRTFILNLIWIA